ncbi:hypothetical protein GCM10010145_22750 [Streptomyces ruber]|uniref:HTH cro/C1-type domain-containing protein n=2 Tax=Streptomyces TaxID=1883 RepID=A0A918BDG8_9ACTN|nr:helix-turn-helix transcriptional regulator [Streptomyces ruber]GGQ52722.1 hypothetical protein GCM10010145_22750 [Streptomyces ruber]
MNQPLRAEVTAADIAQLLAEVDGYAWRLGRSRHDFLDPALICEQTGIAEDRVRELLEGAEPQQPPREKTAREAFFRTLVAQRLTLARRLRARGTPAAREGLRTIAGGTGISSTQVAHLLNGDRSARLDHVWRLEEYFGVPEGFFSRTEGEALGAHLRKMARVDLPVLVLRTGMQEMDATGVALRATGDLSPEETLRQLVPAFDALAARLRAQDRAAHRASGQDTEQA